jgi:hypothetical protein
MAKSDPSNIFKIEYFLYNIKGLKMKKLDSTNKAHNPKHASSDKAKAGKAKETKSKDKGTKNLPAQGPLGANVAGKSGESQAPARPRTAKGG